MLYVQKDSLRRTMAIDDNTSYELTGYQVKDLAGRIRG